MKHLVICCDGTWQEIESEYPTNVIKLAQSLLPADKKDNPQIVYYDPGVGTEIKNSLSGGAFGYGLSRNIIQAYTFLSLNYQPGDKVYLFGFSRGAYTVRSLAGLMYNSGLPSREHIRRIPRAYELYRDKDVKPSSDEASMFREAFGQRVDIEILGCWDTVGSLGVPDAVPFIPLDNWINSKYMFHNCQVNRRVKNAFHAASIDEKRASFDITYMTPSDKNADDKTRQNIVEKWFPGDHGSIGGGDRETENLSNITLDWMVEMVNGINCGLEIDLSLAAGGHGQDPAEEFDNSLNGIFKILGHKDRDVNCSYKGLHKSVKKRWKAIKIYRPANLKKFKKQLDK